MKLIFNEWLELGDEKCKGMMDAAYMLGNCLVLMKFDDGSYCLYDDEFPVAVLTHYMIIKK